MCIYRKDIVWEVVAEFIAESRRDRARERGGYEHDEGRHDSGCEERHFNDPAKRTPDLE